MIVSVCAYLTIIVFEPHSIYSMRLAKKGELITHHKDRAVLTLMNIESIVETDFLKVRPDMDLGEMVKTISKSSRNLFPVVDVNDELIGIVELDDIRNIIFRQELYHLGGRVYEEAEGADSQDRLDGRSHEEIRYDEGMELACSRRGEPLFRLRFEIEDAEHLPPSVSRPFGGIR